MEFLKKIESAILSEDPFVQQYAVTILKDSFLATEDTFLIALDAYDKGQSDLFPASILPHIDFMPIAEKGMQEIMSRLDIEHEHLIYFLRLAANAPVELQLKYKEKMPYTNQEYYKVLGEIKQSETPELHHQLQSVIVQLESNYFNDSLFKLGKQMLRELLLRNEISEAETVNSLRSYIQDHSFIPYDGIYKIFLAGELRLDSLVPDLIMILKTEEDVAVEEAAKALIKIGTPAVVKAVEEAALHENACFFAVDILAKIKASEAEAALLRLFNETDRTDIKTVIADALCQQLSVKGIPLVESMLKKGFDSSILDLKESFYANVKINGIDHPLIDELERRLKKEVEKQRVIQERMDAGLIPLNKSPDLKAGRNDPCPCGSGKKFKKCCLN
ncbi:hypothetical protein BK139_06310 [Paenibacillus sp. FSL R5-0490]|uniref:HEAT repeat domain-containing protein n=1 Tax=Paenibacillus sp. FSL R5-0490 TaxID=1920424 RepID=UPI00096D1AB0|nr:HEAT repeat domain-containing protein [Paenibacillus sp. FSL R5-0490]OMF61453.1 hypothetical protein BK139_06310 [Paenibacillus sp. FSL R5-0490]